MTKTQMQLIERAITNGGRAAVYQDWGRTPTGGFIRGSRARELKALRALIDAGMVTYKRFPADPQQTIRSTSNGYTAHGIEHNFTLTDHGLAAYKMHKGA